MHPLYPVRERQTEKNTEANACGKRTKCTIGLYMDTSTLQFHVILKSPQAAVVHMILNTISYLKH